MIFNLWALIPLPIIIGLVIAMDSLFPAFTNGQYGNLAASALTLAVGTICELIGVRGRLFFIPIWAIGIIMVAIQTIVLWGWIGVANAVALLLITVVWLIKKARKWEKQKWKTAKKKLPNLSNPELTTDAQAFWGTVKECLYLPSLNKYNEEICSHNLVVTEASLSILEDSPASIQRSDWQKLRDYFQSWPSADPKPSLENKLQESIQEFLDKVTTPQSSKENG